MFIGYQFNYPILQLTTVASRQEPQTVIIEVPASI